MPSLVLSRDTVRVSLLSKRLEITCRVMDEHGERCETAQVPLFDLDRVVVVGTPAISIPALTTLMDNGIPVFFVTSHGRWRGSISPDNNLNAARRIRQYEQGTDPEFALDISRKLIYAKLRNSRRVLQRLAANRSETEAPAHVQVCEALKGYANQVVTAETVDIARGIEGMGAARYFQRLGTYFPETIPFKGRNRQPPRDPANALLSWTYTILLGEVEGCVRAHGLDAGIGCLHCDKVNTPSLALDLMEPLRPAFADLLVLNIVNHLMMKPDGHFEVREEDGGTYLNAEGRRSFFLSYEHAMARRFSLTKGGPHTDFRHIIEDQVCTFIKALEQGQPPEFFILP